MKRLILLFIFISISNTSFGGKGNVTDKLTTTNKLFSILPIPFMNSEDTEVITYDSVFKMIYSYKYLYMFENELQLIDSIQENTGIFSNINNINEYKIYPTPMNERHNLNILKQVIFQGVKHNWNYIFCYFTKPMGVNFETDCDYQQRKYGQSECYIKVPFLTTFKSNDQLLLPMNKRNGSKYQDSLHHGIFNFKFRDSVLQVIEYENMYIGLSYPIQVGTESELRVKERVKYTNNVISKLNKILGKPKIEKLSDYLKIYTNYVYQLGKSKIILKNENLKYWAKKEPFIIQKIIFEK